MQTLFLNNLAILGVIGITVFVFVAVFLQWQVLRSNRRIDRIFRGIKKENIEEMLNHQLDLSEKMRQDIERLFQDGAVVRNIAKKSIHKTGIVRFNPFQDTGGDQSFSVALLDADDTGFVVSSLHSRDGTRMYLKPIVKGISEKYKLTKEEEEAIKKAKNSFA